MKLRCVGLRIVIAVLSLVVIASCCRTSSAAVTELKFADTASEYALDPESGNIAAVDPTNNKVSLYGPNFTDGATAKPIASLVVGNRPGSIVFKQAGKVRLFAVGCLSENNIYLFDAATLKQTAKIPITGSDVTSVAASLNPDDPYVYYCYGRGHDSATGRVQVLKHVDEGLAFDDSMDCAISASGNLAYRRGPWSPSGFESLRKVEPTVPGGKVSFQRVFYDHNSTAQYVVDPFDVYTATGPKLYTARLDKSVAMLQFAPLRFFPDRPFAVGFDQYIGSQRHMMPSSRSESKRKLVVASTNSFQNVVELELPNSFTSTGEQENLARGNSQADFKFVGNRTSIFVDSARSRLVLVRDKRGLIVPYADLKLPDEPFLMVQADAKSPLLVGMKSTLPLTKKDARIKIELLDKPEGVALTAAGLEWTPTEDQIGAQPVRVKLTHGALERTQTIEAEVARPFLALPASVSGLASSDDGKTLVGWTVPAMSHMHNPGPPGSDVPRCVLVDSINGKVLASGPLPFAAQLVSVDQHFVYAVQPGTGVVTALGRDDLGHRKQISLEGVTTWIRPLGNKELIIGMSDGRWLKYSVPDLKLITENRIGLNGGNFGHDPEGNQSRSGMKRIAEGWLMPSGTVFDESLTKPVFLKTIVGLRAAGLPINFDPRNRQEDGGRMPQFGHSFRSPGGAERAVVASVTFGARQSALLLTRAVETVQVPGAIHTNKSTETWTLMSLAPGRSDTTGALTTVVSKSDDIANMQENIHFNVIPGALVVVDGHVFCGIRGRLYRVPLAGLTFSDAEEAKPPKFKQAQSTLVVDLSGKTILKHEVVDGIAPVQYALSSAFGGIEIEPRDGTVTLDGPTLSTKLIDFLSGKVSRSTNMPSNGGAFESSEAIDQYLHTASVAYEQVTGSKPKGVPFALSIALQATDSTPRTAIVSYYVLADLPRGPLERQIAERAAEIAKMREEARLAKGAGGTGGAIDGATQERIRQLELRITGLEAQLKILTQLLGEGAR